MNVQPCPSDPSADLLIDTATIDPGVHSIEFCARDYGFPEGNLGCSRPYTIQVDNVAPLQPVNLQVAGGADRWHPENDFDISWVNPPQGAGAPIAAVHYRLYDAEGNRVDSSVRIADPTPSLEDVIVPGGPGRYTIEVLLEDAAGNLGAPASAALRFDNTRPGPASLLIGDSWLSRNELPFLQRLGHPGSPLPVSGIRGYAYSVSQTADSDPCSAFDRCTESETDLRDGIEGDGFEVSDPPEGTSWIHAVAVSGSGMKSTAVARREIQVDKTDPVTTIEGVPAGWSATGVAITAHAADMLSGMSANGAGAPFTAISVDGGPAVTSPGDSVTTSVTGDGIHALAYYARDAAGNVNDGGVTNGVENRPPAYALVRIDRTAPGLAFVNTQDPDDPELIRASVNDRLSGPDPERGAISVRRVGHDDTFTQLPTELVDGDLVARWASDSFPAGEYEFRATAFDTAGNSVRTGRRANGSEMVLPNPIKLPTAIRARLRGKDGSGRRVRALTLRYGSTAQMTGRLTAGLGSPLSGEPVEVVETFAPGSAPRSRVTRLRTGRRGIFSLRLRPGPNRMVRARYAGTRTLTRSHSQAVRLRTTAGVTLSTSAAVASVRGRPLLFRGRVKHQGARVPRVGIDVELQYRVGTVPWTTFRTVRSNAFGRWNFSYGFSDSESRGITFSFRARVPRESDWPFAAGQSPPRRIRVR